MKKPHNLLKGIDAWNIGRDPRTTKKYLGQVSRFTDQLGKIRTNERDVDAVYRHLFCEESPRVGKRLIRKVIEACLEDHPEVARKAMIYELAEFGLKRFSAEEFFSWIESWTTPYHKGTTMAVCIFEQLKANKVDIPKEKILTYARVLATMFLYRTMGNMLINFKLDTDESITTEEIYGWALTSAEMKGHDITRTFSMLITRIGRGKRYVKVRMIRAIAEILCIVRYDRLSSDNQSTTEFLIQMAYHALLYRPFKRLLIEYRKALSRRHDEMRRDMESDLAYGSWPAPPRNHRP